FLDLVQAQGGDISYVEDPRKFPLAAVIKTVTSPKTGYISQIHARIVGETAVDLGAGRAKKDDLINHAVGIEILKEVGDFIQEGENLFVLHAANQKDFDLAKERLLEAHQWSESPVPALPLVYEVIG
ncbi:MAG: pyrimidine-nucleoside phosphorylase, partial [Anaerolineales bacterium]|nr:pyrimidine-nucleoside phosphorylase [Anaerolineales bacterium]